MTISRRSFLATTGFAMTGAALAAPQMIFGKDEVPALLDHILLGCNDLDKGITFVEEKTGVRAAFGGVHPGRGTRNALLSLGERHYLEIIAPDPAQPNATESLSLALKKLTEPRLVGWAAHPGDIDAFAKRLLDAGLAFEGPRPGSRKRPDGRLLQWRSLSLKDDRGGILPFFIQWSADSVHPSADAPVGCKIANFEMSGPDPSELNRLCKLLDLDASVGRREELQLRARIAGPGGKVLDVTS